MTQLTITKSHPACVKHIIFSVQYGLLYLFDFLLQIQLIIFIFTKL